MNTQKAERSHKREIVAIRKHSCKISGVLSMFIISYMTWSEPIKVTGIKAILVLIFFILFILTIIISLIMRHTKARKEDITIPTIIGTSWLDISVTKSYRAPKIFSKFIRLGSNSLNPLLIIYDDKIKMRAVGLTYTRTRNDFDKVSANDGVFGKNIRFDLKSGAREIFYIPNTHNIDQLMNFLEKKWVTIE